MSNKYWACNSLFLDYVLYNEYILNRNELYNVIKYDIKQVRSRREAHALGFCSCSVSEDHIHQTLAQTLCCAIVEGQSVPGWFPAEFCGCHLSHSPLWTIFSCGQLSNKKNLPIPVLWPSKCALASLTTATAPGWVSNTHKFCVWWDTKWPFCYFHKHLHLELFWKHFLFLSKYHNGKLK